MEFLIPDVDKLAKNGNKNLFHCRRTKEERSPIPLCQNLPCNWKALKSRRRPYETFFSNVPLHTPPIASTSEHSIYYFEFRGSNRRAVREKCFPESGYKVAQGICILQEVHCAFGQCVKLSRHFLLMQETKPKVKLASASGNRYDFSPSFKNAKRLRTHPTTPQIHEFCSCTITG